MRAGHERSGGRQRCKVPSVLIYLVVLGIALGLGTSHLVAAAPNSENPQSGGMGIPTGGLVTTFFAEPINYESSGYYYDPSNTLQYANYVFHHGIDVSGGCVAGVNPVYAAAAGTVAVAQFVNDGYGTQVILDNGYNVGGNGKYTYTFYAHMGNGRTGQRYLMVSPGQYVQAGQLVGYQGNDGAAFGSCAPDPGTHLDWEIRITSIALAYSTAMRYNATAASPNYYTYNQLTYNDAAPVYNVSPGPFNGPPPPPPAPTSTPVPAPPPPSACGMSFSDVPGSYWAYSYIDSLYCRSVIGGYGDGTFRPANNTTRGQFTKMLALSFGWNLYDPAFPTFSDVPPGSIYYRYIETAYLREIISGYQDGTFRPNEPISRAQTAKMIVSAEGWQPIYPAFPPFSDVPAEHWACGYIQAAYNNGIVTGYSDGTFHPAAQVSRAQLSKMLTLAPQP